MAVGGAAGLLWLSPCCGVVCVCVSSLSLAVVIDLSMDGSCDVGCGQRSKPPKVFSLVLDTYI